jgi:predicted MFS family arabinose efflux permease
MLPVLGNTGRLYLVQRTLTPAETFGLRPPPSINFFVTALRHALFEPPMCAAAFAALCQRDRMISSSRSMLYRFLILYGSLYAGFGVQSPYLPILLDNRYLRVETIALALAAGTAMRLMAAQAVARLADRLDAPKVILALCTAAAALIGLGYLPAKGAWLLIAVGVLHSAALAPLPPLSDTLALGAAAPAGSGGAVIH